ncbi:MAG: hypothetical protein UU81_C0044G0013 [Microgenomates group bacterium GW2011_GWC1_41_8]|uniref:Uncharacterized protein n=3 Tax=Candidatus Roizmaniibacteriota TaxID=1752723 RepID=A0A0G0XB22_9BACT|nr:MAG: hypothetical protein UU14_C0008G0021 [Candidatus Roizmanbacteria bacterium GW2011_GWB1_40_7]KKR94277.1 MAG: hypothetical protein UU41_C0009G0023 [Candidatus Roizmanbacteria bacterium GW2011_GWA1_41_13]KKS22095.1 MAG: hypothetical protein UU78_C0023G0021 [Candidatus Roizmanbacteria bacterium GW2011_GWC2_41_7]KKS22977.1 MAG: hypothetical protein UU81_C0044G0013 [Microgenomates group bacterium GW2011_GWC1_41_8]
MKHEPNATANAAAVTVAVLYVVCRIAIALFPDLAMSVAQSWFHGLELSKVSSWNLSMGPFILGLVTSVISAWLVGYVFATAYNYFVKR